MSEKTTAGKGKDLIQRAYEALDRSALDELVSVYSQDVEMVTPDTTLHGIDQVRSYFEAIRTAFPDVSHRLVSTVESGRSQSASLAGGGEPPALRVALPGHRPIQQPDQRDHRREPNNLDHVTPHHDGNQSE